VPDQQKHEVVHNLPFIDKRLLFTEGNREIESLFMVCPILSIRYHDFHFKSTVSMKMFDCNFQEGGGKFRLAAGLFPCGIADTILPASVLWGAEIQV
jgi:hypothetical protein